MVVGAAVTTLAVVTRLVVSVRPGSVAVTGQCGRSQFDLGSQAHTSSDRRDALAKRRIR